MRHPAVPWTPSGFLPPLSDGGSGRRPVGGGQRASSAAFSGDEYARIFGQTPRRRIGLWTFRGRNLRKNSPWREGASSPRKGPCPPTETN